MRFLSRKAGAYLEEDKRVWVDMLADGVEDFRSRYGKLAYNSDAASLQQGEWKLKDMHKLFSLLTQSLAFSRDGSHRVPVDDCATVAGLL